MKTAEAKIIASIASGCSLLAILSCLTAIPNLYFEINQLYDEVIDTVSVFLRTKFFLIFFPPRAGVWGLLGVGPEVWGGSWCGVWS